MRVVAGVVAAMDVDVVAGGNHLRWLQMADLAKNSDAGRVGREAHGVSAALAGHGRGGISGNRSSRIDQSTNADRLWDGALKHRRGIPPVAGCVRVDQELLAVAPRLERHGGSHADPALRVVPTAELFLASQRDRRQAADE